MQGMYLTSLSVVGHVLICAVTEPVLYLPDHLCFKNCPSGNAHAYDLYVLENI